VASPRVDPTFLTAICSDSNTGDVGKWCWVPRWVR